MKKMIYLGAFGAILCGSCKKESTIAVAESQNKVKPNTVLAASPNGYQSIYFADLMKNSKVWDVLEDGNGTLYCETANGSCTKSNKPVYNLSPATYSALMAEIDLIGTLQNPNDYFDTQHWPYLFEELEHNEELLESIRANEVHLIVVPSGAIGTTVGYVLTTATSIDAINNDNILMAWVY